MATERQIAANRRNARKSTGPRSPSAKRRSSQNAFRHGLSSHTLLPPLLAESLERLARQIAGPDANPLVLEHARTAAHAQFEIARVQRVKISLIERFLMPRPLAPSASMSREQRRCIAAGLRGRVADLQELVDSSITIPVGDADCTAEAVRRALPDLLKLDRYEARAFARRDRAIREIARLRMTGY